jgi:uncharacterized protein (TIGR00251 family)
LNGWLRAAADGVTLLVTAAPRASRTEITGVAEGRLRIRIAAPPVEGEANAELVRFLAKALRVSRSSVVVTGGAAGRRKTVLVRGAGADTVRKALAP